MTGDWIYWLVGVIVVIAVVAIVAAIVSRRRGTREPESIPDPPYDRKKVPDPTEGDPQVVHQADPEDIRYPDGPDNMRNPNVDHKGPGPSTPGTFPPPGTAEGITGDHWKIPVVLATPVIYHWCGEDHWFYDAAGHRPAGYGVNPA